MYGCSVATHVRIQWEQQKLYPDFVVVHIINNSLSVSMLLLGLVGLDTFFFHSTGRSSANLTANDTVCCFDRTNKFTATTCTNM